MLEKSSKFLDINSLYKSCIGCYNGFGTKLFKRSILVFAFSALTKMLRCATLAKECTYIENEAREINLKKWKKLAERARIKARNIENKAFREHLEKSSAIVKTWPPWKQSVLRNSGYGGSES
jgi:hypothetical protein